MTFNFNNSKKLALTKKDKSNISEIDLKIKDLCNKVNLFDNYFTTSSCSGRIVLIKDDNKKKPGIILFRNHEKVSLENLKKELEIKCKEYKELIIEGFD